MSTVKVLVTRPLMYRGERRERNEVLAVPPAEAWQLCSGGRAEMLDAKRDGAAVHAAVQANNAAALKAAAAAGPAPVRYIGDGPWQPV